MSNQEDPGASQHRLALMQPYFLPYLGYFQLIAAADQFICYDDVQFIKNGWIERNRYLLDGEAHWFRVSLAKGRHTGTIRERTVSQNFDLQGMLNKLRFAYRKAPFKTSILGWLEHQLADPPASIAVLNERVIRSCCQLLDIQTPILRSSDVLCDCHSHGQQRVIDIARAVGATHYINPMGGAHLYDAKTFAQAGLTLEFLRPVINSYCQGESNQPFVPGLSILDALMFNEPGTIAQWVRDGEVHLA